MSLRKGLTLLLLAAFGLSTVAPALAININQGVVFNTIAQDDGTASTGAKQDVVATNILFDLNNAGDLFLASDSTDFDVADAVHLSTAGIIDVTGDTGRLTTQAATLFVPPTGCKFVKLPNYQEVTTANFIDIDDGDNTAQTNNNFINAFLSINSNFSIFSGCKLKVGA